VSGFDRTLRVARALTLTGYVTIQNVAPPSDAQWNAERVDFSGFFGPHKPETFAAAPDLLSALRDMLAVCKTYQDDKGQAAIMKARAAIAAATGEGA
jgi:hypothetical protein